MTAAEARNHSGGAVFEAEDVSHWFYSTKRKEYVEALRDSSFIVPSGSVVALIGPSGCGKSTLLNMMAGLIAPSRGRLLFDGIPVPIPNTNAGYVTQADTLLPWRRVRENVEVALEIRQKELSRTDRARRAGEILELVGLSGFEHAYPFELSGGMRQRVGLARVLIYAPKVILMDEPFGALDAQLRVQMQNEFLRVWSEVGGSVVFVTHDLEEAVGLSDYVLVMTPRPGRLAANIEIDLPRPRELTHLRYTTEFVNYCALVRDALEAGGLDATRQRVLYDI